MGRYRIFPPIYRGNPTLSLSLFRNDAGRLRPFRGSAIPFRFYGVLWATARSDSSGRRRARAFLSRIEVFTPRELIIRGTAAGARISGYNLAGRAFQLRAAGLISHLRARSRPTKTEITSPSRYGGEGEGE